MWVLMLLGMLPVAFFLSVTSREKEYGHDRDEWDAAAQSAQQWG
jgi:hypothetical protein